MEKRECRNKVINSYREIQIGKTTYRVTSIFLGEKDLGETLEQLAVRRAMTEIKANINAS